MENGKNPGLGIRALHGQGITGEGVSVAIIDEAIFLEPPEFSDRIVDYYECHDVQSQGGCTAMPLSAYWQEEPAALLLA